jgi:hypothetical protein
MKTQTLLALLSLLVVTQGCARDNLTPIIEIPRHRALIVMPFHTDQAPNGFDSDRGTELAERLIKLLKEKAEFRVKGVQVVLDIYNDPTLDTDTLTAKQIAEITSADYVLMGDVVSWRHADPDTIGLKRGSSSIDVTLYETAAAAQERIGSPRDDLLATNDGRGVLALRKHRVSTCFPQEYGMSEVGSPDFSDEQIESGLLTASALQVAWLLVPHSKNEQKLAAGK